MGNTLFKKPEDSNNISKNKRYFSFSYNKPIYRLLMVGLDATGKSTLLYNLTQNFIPPCFPTIGFNVEQIQYEKNTLQLWQVAGGWAIRQLWKHYLDNVKGALYIIDLSDQQRLQEALKWLQNLLQLEGCKDKYLFIIGNKRDLAEPTMYKQLQERIIEMNIKQRYRIKYVNSLIREELIQAFREISQIFAIVS